MLKWKRDIAIVRVATQHRGSSTRLTRSEGERERLGLALSSPTARDQEIFTVMAFMQQKVEAMQRQMEALQKENELLRGKE